jgi:hypothetical protein
VAIVVGAVVISKRRSTSIAAEVPGGSGSAAGPGPSVEPAAALANNHADGAAVDEAGDEAGDEDGKTTAGKTTT